MEGGGWELVPRRQMTVTWAGGGWSQAEALAMNGRVVALCLVFVALGGHVTVPAQWRNGNMVAAGGVLVGRHFPVKGHTSDPLGPALPAPLPRGQLIL